MRVRSLCKVIYYPLFVWFLLVCLYIILPSPSYPDDGYSYATSVLSAGKTLTRVYKISGLYPYYDYSDTVKRARESHKEALTLDFTLGRGWNTLRLGAERTVNLTRPEMEFVSEPFVLWARTGDFDGIILASLQPADAMLLFWRIYHDTAEIPLRIRWNEHGNIEIWPDSERWNSGSFFTENLPILTLGNLEEGPGRRFFASVPAPPRSSSPPTTYPIRVSILNVVVPFGMFVYKTMNRFSPALVGIGSFLTWVFALLFCPFVILLRHWVREGERPLDEFIDDLKRDPWKIVHFWRPNPERRRGAIIVMNSRGEIEKGL